MKKIISLVTTLSACTVTLTPVMVLQNKTTSHKYSLDLKEISFNKKYKFTVSSSNKFVSVADAEYTTRDVVLSGGACQESTCKYYVYLTPLGAKLMWLFTTHGPVKHHPSSNYLWWLNTYGPGFNTHLKQTGDYLIGIKDGMSGNIIGDDSIISDFESHIGNDLWNKIETYMNSKTTANLELSLEYLGNNNEFNVNSFYVNASWSH